MSKLYENPTIYELFVLLEELRNGAIRVPKFQRPFVWDDDQRLELLDSVARGLPIGSILVWRSHGVDVPTYEELEGWRVGPERKGEARTVVLDGHQRLVTLLSAFYEPDVPDRCPVDVPVYYDLEGDRFLLAPKGRRRREPVKAHWMPMTATTSNGALFAFQRPLFEAGEARLANKAEALRNQIFQYRIPVIPVVSESFSQATLAFLRINRGSSPMGEPHLLHALMASHNVDLLAHLATLRDQLPPGWKELDLDAWIGLVKLRYGMSFYSKDTPELAKRLNGQLAPFDEAHRALRQAIEWLRTVPRVEERRWLPYSLQLTFLAHAAQTRGGPLPLELHGPLWEWFWRSGFTEQFTGLAEGRVSRALKMFLGALNDPATAERPEEVIQGPPRHRRESARLRCLRAILHTSGAGDDVYLDWRDDPDRRDGETWNRVVEAERARALEVGLHYDCSQTE